MARSTTPHSVSVNALDDPPRDGSGPAIGTQRADHPVPEVVSLVHGDDGVKELDLVADVLASQDCEDMWLVRVELRLLGQHRVLDGVFPAVAVTPFVAVHLVNRRHPRAAIGIADPVVQQRNLLIEDGPGDESTALVPLDEVLPIVDQNSQRRCLRLGEIQRANGHGNGHNRQGRQHQPAESGRLQSVCHGFLLRSLPRCMKTIVLLAA